MHKFWRPAAECLVAGVVLVSLTAICYRLHFNLAMTSLLYVIVVVLISRAGGFVSSIVASIIAALCLAHIAAPAFSFRVDDPLDAVAIIAFLVASLTIASLVSKLQKMVDEARSSVNRKLIDAEDQERTRIARELHDDINQRLAVLAINLEGLQHNLPSSKAEIMQEIAVAGKQVQDLGSDVQALSHHMHSSKLEYLGLAAAAAGFCREVSNQRGVEIDFHSEKIPNDLSKDASLCLFRVLQEAIQNATKHSGSRHFEVLLSGGLGEVELTVRDSGIGFDPEEAMKGNGLGLTSIRERLKLVNGNLSIDSQPQHGATIQARVPLTSRMKSVGAAG